MLTSAFFSRCHYYKNRYNYINRQTKVQAICVPSFINLSFVVLILQGVDLLAPLFFIKNDFDAEFLFTDTDSLTYEIKSENVYEDFFEWKDLFDFSNYSKDSKFFDNTNKKVIGKIYMVGQ